MFVMALATTGMSLVSVMIFDDCDVRGVYDGVEGFAFCDLHDHKKVNPMAKRRFQQRYVSVKYYRFPKTRILFPDPAKVPNPNTCTMLKVNNHFVGIQCRWRGHGSDYRWVISAVLLIRIRTFLSGYGSGFFVPYPALDPASHNYLCVRKIDPFLQILMQFCCC
jgi:hypothetical protein